MLEVLEGNLTTLIQNGSQLGATLEHLNEEQKTRVLTALTDTLATIIKDGSQLGAALRLLNEEQQCLVLETLSEHLHEMIRYGHQLREVLATCVTASPRTIVLNAIRGRLPRLVDANTLGNTEIDNQIKAALKYCHYGLFNATRMEQMNTGSLSNKLEKYIEACQKEYCSHGDVIGMITLFDNLFGWDSVNTKETKLAAATYALHAHKNEDACLVRLKELDAMPQGESSLKAQYANSYLLVGNAEAPKKLYYVDYEGHSKELKVKDVSEIQPYFNQETQTKTYQEASDLLSQPINGKLPTNLQLEALKEGLLGDIMRDAGEDAILDGTKKPVNPQPDNRSATEEDTPRP